MVQGLVFTGDTLFVAGGKPMGVTNGFVVLSVSFFLLVQRETRSLVVSSF